MSLSRRDFQGLLGGLALSAARPQATAAAQTAGLGRSRLILLGTGGGPVLGGQRAMSASAIIVGGSAYLIDCGYGASSGLVKANIPLRDLEAIFVTHNHADHVIDYGPLLFFTWLQGRAAPIEVFGPPPLQHMTELLLAANATPLALYREDMAMGPMPKVVVHESARGGSVMQDRDVKVTSALVVHPPVVPSFAYRFDLPDRSIVFSGDTAPTESLVTLAKDADILVHEATEVDAMLRLMTGANTAQSRPRPQEQGATPKNFNESAFVRHVHSAHSSAEAAGAIAAAAKVKTLVLNHLAPGGAAAVSDATWREEAARRFAGEIIVGHDGLEL